MWLVQICLCVFLALNEKVVKKKKQHISHLHFEEILFQKQTLVIMLKMIFTNLCYFIINK